MKKKGIWILLGLLVILIGIYFLAQWQQKREAEQEADAPTYVTANGNFNSIEYTDGESTMKFVLEEDTWVYEGDESIPLQQSEMQSMANVFGYIQAIRTLEEYDELNDYGLDKPTYTITLGTDEAQTKLLVGIGIGENYYVQVEGEDIIYTVSGDVINAMQFDIESLREVEETTEK